MKIFTQADNCKRSVIIVSVILLCLINDIKVSCQTWTGSISSNWNTGSNWSTGNAPTSATAVIIPNGVTNYPVISTGINALANSVNIESGASLTMNATGNLTLSYGGVFLNNGTFNTSGSTGAVIFAGNGTVSGRVTFNNIIINGAVDFDSTGTSVVTGNLTLNAGGSASGPSTHLISYTSASTLIYNTSVIAGNEWYQGGSGTINPGAGIPQDVVIQSGTVNIPNSGGTNRALAGNLIINTGAVLQFAVVNTRDLFVGGNWTNTGNFFANGRRVTFDAATGTQTISGNTTFYDLTLDNTGASTDFGSSVVTMDDELRANHGTMNGGTSTFIFNSNSCTLEGISSKRFYNLLVKINASVADLTSTAGDIHITNSFINDGIFKQHNSHTTYFDKSGTTENISGNGTTTFGNIVIGKSGTGSGTILNENAHNFTVSGTAFTFNHSNSVFKGGTGTVTFNGVTDLIGNSSGSVSGTIASFNGVKILNTTSFGIDATFTGPLIINAGNTLAINSNTLTLNGTIAGSGTLTGSAASNIIFGSNGDFGSLYFDQTINNVTNVLKDFKIKSGTVSLGNLLNITAGTAVNTYGTVTVDGTLNTGGNLTLKSNAGGDAIIGNSNGTIAGNVTVERYIPARRAWRFLGVPTKSTQTIKAAWQEGGQNLLITDHVDPKPGYGTEITYNNNQAAGFDQNPTNNPSIKVWDVNTNGWSLTIPNTNSLISNYPAYCLFVRGSRAIDLSLGVGAGTDNTTLRTIGGLNIGNVTKPYTTVAGNEILVSNPYASPINILNVATANATDFAPNKFWVWDPAFSGSYGVGGYITYSETLTVPAGSTYSGGTTAQSGQAFMLEAKRTGTYAVSFTESNKVATETNVFGKEARQLHPVIYTNLIVSSGDSLILVDGVGTAFGKNFSAAVDDIDAQKLWNIDEENIALIRDDKRLAIEFRPVPTLTDTLFFKLFLRQQPYALKIFSENLPANLPAQGWLVDKYLNTKTAVNLYDTTLYNFTPVADAHGDLDTNSYRNRFMLVFNRQFEATPIIVTRVNNQDNPGTTGNASLIAAKESGVSIYPNPIETGGKVILKFANLIKGKFEVTVSNADGKALTKKTIDQGGGNTTYTLQTDSQWAAGSYIIKITGEGGFNYTTKLVVGK